MKYFFLCFLVFFVSCSFSETEIVQQPVETVQANTDVKASQTPEALQVAFSFPDGVDEAYFDSISNWKNEVIRDTKAEIASGSTMLRASPSIEFDVSYYAFDELESIMYFVKKNIYKAQPEYRTKVFLWHNGEEIAAGSLLDIEKYQEKLVVLLEKQLQKTPGVYTTDVREKLTKYLEHPKIYIADNSFVFVFDRQDAIAPYSAGITKVRFPYPLIKQFFREPYKNKVQKTEEIPAPVVTQEEVGVDRIHTVQAGEYIRVIAEMYEVTPESIILANSIDNPDTIEVGQKLLIPATKKAVAEPELPKQAEEKNTQTAVQKEEKSVNHAPSEGKYVALSFDDGPNPKTTHQLLHILKKRGVKATFFVIGNNVANYPDTVLWAHNDGHEIANHTLSHPNLIQLSDAEILEEIQSSNTLIKTITGTAPTLVRPPYGAFDERIETLLSDKTILMWNVDSKDRQNRDVQKNLEKVLPDVKNGSIILFHDIHQPSVDTIDILITKLASQGYQFVTVTELLDMGQAESYIGKTCYGAYRCE